MSSEDNDGCWAYAVYGIIIFVIVSLILGLLFFDGQAPPILLSAIITAGILWLWNSLTKGD